MARMPGAQWRPLGDDQDHQPLMSAHDGIILHTMVGSLAGTDAYFKQGGYSGTESHFGVGYDGTIYQWVDTARTADANLEGNARYLSIETADSGTGFPSWDGSNVPPWLPAQLDAIARIIAWAANEHDFPIVRMPDSKPGRQGVGYHRLGIDPWRVDGGLKYSTSYAKACPGDRRIAQVDAVIGMARSGKAPYPQWRDTSRDVAPMVQKLRYAGYFNGKRGDKVNYYGAFTRGAVRRFQEAQGWSGAAADGLMGPETWRRIQALPDGPQKPPPPPPPDQPDRLWPILDDPREAIGDAIRALEPVTEAHPKWRFGTDMLTRWKADWFQLHSIQNPDK